MEILTDTALFGGRHLVVRHQSAVTNCAMEVAILSRLMKGVSRYLA